MNYILDLILLGILILLTVIGVRRGVIRSAVHFVGSVIAAFLSSALGEPLARWIYNALFREALVEKIGESIQSLGVESAAAAVKEVLSGLPDFLLRALEKAGVTAASLQGTLANQTGKTAELIADSLSPVFISFLRVLAAIVLFALFMMLVRVLADALDSAFHLPILREINGLLGGLFGFLLALVIIWVGIAAIQVFTPMLSAERQYDVQLMLKRSLLAGILVNINPLGAIF